MIGFVHIEKTAGSTVKFILRNSLGIHHCDVRPLGRAGPFSEADLRFAKRLFPGLRSIAGHRLIRPSAHVSSRVAYFTFVREPLERFASLYQFRRQDPGRRGWRHAPRPTLEEFLSDQGLWNGQVRQLAGSEDLQQAVAELERYFFVGLTEQFDESLSVLRALCPYRLDLRYRRENVAPDNSIKRRLLADRSTREAILQANRLDIALYHHVRSTLFPALRASVDRDATRPPAHEDPGFFPWRYHLNRLYNNTVYRPLWKLRRGRPHHSPSHARPTPRR